MSETLVSVIPEAEQVLSGRSKQAAKSQSTRIQLLNATVECLVERGFMQTTTQAIAQKAGVSRGAMMHHFESRLHVIREAAHYIADQRAREYGEFVLHVEVEDDPSFSNTLKTVEMLQLYYYQTPFFSAWQELQGSARANKQLAEIIEPLQSVLDEAIIHTITTRFPIWEVHTDVGVLLRDLFFSVIKGVAANTDRFMCGERMQRLNGLLARIAIEEHQRAIGRPPLSV
jgi:AcrR family transcriptional regulator